MAQCWIEGILVGAILSPTDPVFVSVLLGRVSVPLRLRHLLSVESGFNDGLAVPAVMAFLALAAKQEADLWGELRDVGTGILLGIGVPILFTLVERRPFFSASSKYRPLAGFSVALLLYGLSKLLHANEFLAAFSGGVMLASVGHDYASALHEFGEPLNEVVKLAVVLVFGIVLSNGALLSVGAAGVAFAAISLFLVRPLAILLAMVDGGLSRKEWFVTAWFGPRGFASLLYATLMLNADIPRASWLFYCTALVIALSVVLHSSTCAVVARLFDTSEAAVKSQLEGRQRINQ